MHICIANIVYKNIWSNDTMIIKIGEIHWLFSFILCWPYYPVFKKVDMWHHIWVRIDVGAVKDFQKVCLGRVVRHYSLCLVMCNACLLYHNTLLWLTELLNIQLFVGINLILSCRSIYCHLKCRMCIRQVFRINITSSKIHILGSFLAWFRASDVLHNMQAKGVSPCVVISVHIHSHWVKASRSHVALSWLRVLGLESKTSRERSARNTVNTSSYVISKRWVLIATSISEADRCWKYRTTYYRWTSVIV